ncbi:fimbria/pilus outer membrane usher protein [Paraburkholderia bannensis]|uniref:fimbria/pilus outer membrane usher protein n=1 Tax=Paraburkholderia bannensis TaxID=765414 RepID=UPI002ABD4EE8|nr:fimbria/pilus outer membrane usher protein [Paraburkholderia bannensis]
MRADRRTRAASPPPGSPKPGPAGVVRLRRVTIAVDLALSLAAQAGLTPARASGEAPEAMATAPVPVDAVPSAAMPSAPDTLPPLPAPLPPDTGQTETLALEIIVNGTSRSRPATFELRANALYARPETLTEAGIRTDNVQPLADGWIALDSVPELRYRYEPQKQQVAFEVSTRQQIAQQLGFPVSRPAIAASATGVVLNYDASYVHSWGNSTGSDLGVWSEARFFSPYGVLDNTGTYISSSNTGRYTRLDTNWSYSNPSNLFTITVGDAISGSLPWTRAVRFGGIQIQRDFSLQPTLTTFPLPTIAGSAAVPSAVDLYINGLRQYSGNAAPGPFQIAQPPALTGAGVAQVTVTDVLGRRVTTSIPLYIDTRRLSEGLYDYSAEAGFLRDGYGIDSFSYHSAPFFSGTLRYGLRNWLTLQSHLETAKSLRNGGFGSIVGIGNVGSLSLAIAGSSASSASGALYSAGYQYIGRRFSISLQGAQATPGYRDLVALDGGLTFRHQYQATTSISMLATQTLSASYIDAENSFAGHARVATLGYSGQVGGGCSLYASLYRDFAQHGVWGASIGITIALGGSASASATLTRTGDQSTANVSASRPADFSGGWGWAVQGGAGSDYHLGFASAHYRSTVGDFQATAQHFDGTNTGTLEATGAIAVMDGTVAASRTLGDGFALVSTDQVPNVPVLQENRVVGTTNARGYLLVPDLPSYQRNQIAIDTLALPADAQIDTPEQDIAPQRRSGVLVRFGLKQYTGASVSFIDEAGQPLPVGSVATAQPGGATSVIGYDGVAFLAHLDATNTVSIHGNGADCTASVPFDAASAKSLPQIGPFICERAAAPHDLPSSPPPPKEPSTP